MSTASLPCVLEAPAQPTPLRWSAWTRFSFRCALLYFFWFIFAGENGSLLWELTYIPHLDKPVTWIVDALVWPLNHAALWAATHLFHVTGIGATFHAGGSGDTAVSWVLQLVLVVFALAGGMAWTLAATLRGNRRPEYQTLYAWLRFLLRLTCGMYMLSYGFHKMFPLQMRAISLAVLNEPMGQSSPMTLLWSLIGLNPIYEVICGLAEVLGGVLILFRRTALLGALVSAFVMVNVLLYNLFFDVPVKLFAANLLLALVFIMLPDLGPLYRFFWLHQPAAPVGIWIPPARRRAFRVTTRAIEIVFVFGLIASLGIDEGLSWRSHLRKVGTPTPLVGIWHLDSSAPNGIFLSPEGAAVTELYIDNPDRGYRRSTDGSLWRTTFTVDNSTKTVGMQDSDLETATRYAWKLEDDSHLTLTPITDTGKTGGAGSSQAARAALLTRVPTPAHYPLLDRGFHLVNEWGLER